MPYIIKGLDRETGEPKSLSFDVDNEETAVRMAGKAGCVVQSVRHVHAAPNPDRYKKVSAEHQAHHSKHTSEHREEPNAESHLGVTMVGLSVFVAVISGFIAANESTVLGFIGLGIASLLCHAGVILWAVSSAGLVQLARLQRRSDEMIDLLEIIAGKTGVSKDLEMIRQLRESGQLAEAEYKKNRREILQKNKRAGEE